MRRAVMLLLLTALGIGFASCDWPMFRYDTAHTGYNNTESAIGVSNVGTLVQKWSFHTGLIGPSSFFASSPAVANGVVYVDDADNGLLDAVNATTGALLWRAGIQGGADSSGQGDSPVVANGVVYTMGNVDIRLPDGTSGPDNILYAFDAAGTTNCSATPIGKVCNPLWQYNVGGTASPVNVANGVLFVGTDGSLDETTGALYAINATSGSLLWSGQYGLSNEFESSPAVANGVVYVGTDDNEMAAFDANGVTNCSGTPTICAPLWAAVTGANGSVSASPAVANGVVYVGSGDGNLYAYDANGVTNCTGSPKVCDPLWTGPTGSFIAFSSPAVAKGVVYVGAENGKFYAFDANGVTNCSGTPTTCSPQWTATTGSYIFSSPAVANGVVYAGSLDQKLYAFDASGTADCAGTPKTCTALWMVSTNSEVIASPVVANGNVYFTNEGNLFDYVLP